MAHSAPLISNPKGTNAAIKKALGKNLLQLTEVNDETGLLVKRDALVDVMIALRDECEYQQLMEIAGVDWPSRSPRFEVVYCLLSLTKNHRIRVHVETDEADPVPSVTGIWPVAGWLEREVFDMYGVLFSGNNDLRRILTDYGFEGHPQRKDFPLTGYTELRYSEEEKRVKYEPVKLAQDFRSFDFMSPWEGTDYVLPGDEKAPAAPPPPAPASTPKTTDGPAKTGAGAKANKAAAKTSKPAKPKPKAAKARATKPTATNVKGAK
ncbi:NADH-quinone oxidoreductase subunit C [Sphingorhabdus arenilitoris]|uniref:NADH-quinone oxidoreductase subunit C n=1 Tax=Sphingorhabdus arenilitoris TaxID=1490041 RepID=A0ABV8RIB0_9SPHN